MRVVSRRVVLAVLALGCLIGAGNAAQASARHRLSAKRPIVLRPRFSTAGTTRALTNGRYTFFPSASTAGGTLLDEQTGRRDPVPPAPGCIDRFDSLMGGRFVMLPCPNGYALYAVPNGPWHPVALSAGIQNACDQMEYPGRCSAVAVGSEWLEINEQCYHCLPDYVFQDLRSGHVRQDPTGGSTIPDLNSRTLARQVCSPVTVPNVTNGGWVIPIGRFALSFQAPGPDEPGSWFLQRCGTRIRQVLGVPGESDNFARMHPTLAATPRMVIWAPSALFNAGHPHLEGVYLPSLRHFVVKLPASIDHVEALTLSAAHLYVYSPLGDGHLWAAVLPSEPPSHR